MPAKKTVKKSTTTRKKAPASSAKKTASTRRAKPARSDMARTVREGEAAVKRFVRETAFFSDPTWRSYKDCVDTHRREAERFAAYKMGAEVSLITGVSAKDMAKARRKPGFQEIADATFKKNMKSLPCKNRKPLSVDWLGNEI